jgi:hypothetical protein
MEKMERVLQNPSPITKNPKSFFAFWTLKK